MTTLRVPLLARPQSEPIFRALALAAVGVGIIFIGVLLLDLFLDGVSRLNWDFLTSYPSRKAEKAGVYPALIGTLYIMILTVLFALPIGVGAAVYLEEFAPKNKTTKFIELNIANLAGVPSIIYGLLGLQLFVRVFGFDRSLISGALTLALLALPVIIIVSREAIRTVPKSIREASLALGATRWQTVKAHVLPSAFPGILTGCILAFSRVIGETAPLVTIGALAFVPFAPDGLFSPFTVLPIQSFNWISRPQEEFHANAAAAILVLLLILLFLNSIAIVLRAKFQRRKV